MTPDYSYVYKKLDEAYLGHEEAKQWVLSNVGEVIGLLDAVFNKEAALCARITALEEELENTEYDVNYYEDEIARLKKEQEEYGMTMTKEEWRA